MFLSSSWNHQQGTIQDLVIGNHHLRTSGGMIYSIPQRGAAGKKPRKICLTNIIEFVASSTSWLGNTFPICSASVWGLQWDVAKNGIERHQGQAQKEGLRNKDPDLRICINNADFTNSSCSPDRRNRWPKMHVLPTKTGIRRPNEFGFCRLT